MEFSKALDKLGDTAITREDEEDDIGAAFQKFAVVTKELSALMKNMVSGEFFITLNENSALNAAKCSGIALIIPIIIHSWKHSKSDFLFGMLQFPTSLELRRCRL